jgi:hypothetical protein
MRFQVLDRRAVGRIFCIRKKCSEKCPETKEFYQFIAGLIPQSLQLETKVKLPRLG